MLGLETQNKIQRLVQQGYELGTEIDLLDSQGESTGEKVRLDISSFEEFGALQARLNDAREKLPEKERPDLTEIKVGLALYDHEIIDYDWLVDLLNLFIDNKTPENKATIEKHILPMDEASQQEIKDIIVDIESGEIKQHFTKQSLEETRKKNRSDRQELKIRRWAANQKVNGNRIVEAFELFLPGHSLLDNPKLSEIVKIIEEEEELTFFGASEFETALMDFFNSL
ncbi:hypothetical protein [Lactococcus petauri]